MTLPIPGLSYVHKLLNTWYTLFCRKHICNNLHIDSRERCWGSNQVVEETCKNCRVVVNMLDIMGYTGIRWCMLEGSELWTKKNLYALLLDFKWDAHWNSRNSLLFIISHTLSPGMHHHKWKELLILEFTVNSMDYLVVLHRTLSMFAKFSVHDWRQCRRF